jgi:hypothetical protein
MDEWSSKRETYWHISENTLSSLRTARPPFASLLLRMAFGYIWTCLEEGEALDLRKGMYGRNYAEDELSGGDICCMISSGDNHARSSDNLSCRSR